jgi:DoxX-like family
MSAIEPGEGSGKMIWAGRILTVLTALFMLLDGVMKIVKAPQVLQANVRLAYPLSTLSGISFHGLRSWEQFC